MPTSELAPTLPRCLRPGVAKFRFILPGRGDIEMCQTYLPLAAMEQHVHFEWFTHRRLPRLLVWYVVGNWITHWQQDIEIWENKVHQPSPCSAARTARWFRRRKWCAHFVPEGACLNESSEPRHDVTRADSQPSESRWPPAGS